MEVIVQNGVMSEAEQKHYQHYIAEKYPRLKVRRMFLTIDGDHVKIFIEPYHGILAKMGGALISDPLTWNDAKRAEYFDTIPNTL